ncbi:MAG: 23S ribosomal RNA methyltransferase Erm [Micrococcales bacterium]|nr:23S ribosomal RNA methyltransferase Erm [Micrococcales bacterium]
MSPRPRTPRPSQHGPGRHELGQNFLTDPRVIARVVALTAETDGPIVEWGTGDGALTIPLSRLGRPLRGIEIDARRATRLARRVGPHACIETGDILRHAPPRGSAVVSNVPFHLTTRVLRHLLSEPDWHRAVLLTQWEVARKRAGVGGATQLTAEWWPWHEFTPVQRVPAAAFRPMPTVDGGLLVVDRRPRPLLDPSDRARYQRWVAQVFQSRGRGLAEILQRNGVPGRTARELARHTARKGTPLPRDLDAQGWAEAFAQVPPRPR